LSARASFDDLTRVVADASARVLPSFTTVEVQPFKLARPRSTQRVPAGPSEYLPALRRGGGAVVYLRSSSVQPIGPAAASPKVCAGPALGHLAFVCFGAAAGEPGVTGDEIFANGLAGFTGSTYLLAVEGGARGPSARPVFIPRVDPLADSGGWSSSPLRIPGTPEVGPGTFLFTFDGRFIGLTMAQEEGLVIVPAAALAHEVELWGQQ
jgi:hypothetical protein